jgi:uncharacterized membrane protein
MAIIGLMILLSLIGILTGVIGIILTCALSVWHKIALISLVVFIYSVLIACLEDNRTNGKTN